MAKAVLEKWSIALVGMWNPHVFQPDWIARYLFEQPGMEISVEVPLASAPTPARFSGSKTKFVVVPDRFIVAPSENSEESLVETETVARRVVRTLCHTPVRALGFNFAFAESNPPPSLTDLFRTADRSAISDCCYEVELSLLKHTLRKPNETEVLNVGCTLTEAGVTVDFNFHNEVPDAVKAAELLDGRVLSCKDRAIELLGSVYSLVEEG